ncbi:hypothetical protein Kuja_0710 [Vibrio phage vB_VchM_Kuja]|uniref:Uncharacterized protein n=1 Tax=Vibrio phage vB_VchM_Kuja TaxID=2686437 RepID=A0A6B9JBW3_9CAUD|nr:hypothetical protein HWC83_gp165 [Vibrio phage vB_VchM_Kuja]QGZ16062.1 hypothetical protein Kuja_0710 [Vibrio phage vB_VchM_Kuja]
MSNFVLLSTKNERYPNGSLKIYAEVMHNKVEEQRLTAFNTAGLLGVTKEDLSFTYQSVILTTGVPQTIDRNSQKGKMFTIVPLLINLCDSISTSSDLELSTKHYLYEYANVHFLSQMIAANNIHLLENLQSLQHLENIRQELLKKNKEILTGYTKKQ